MSAPKGKPRVGDVVEYVYGGPGPDVTEILVESVEDAFISGWDLNFWMPTKNIPINKVSILSEEKMERRTNFYTQKRKGTFSVRELAQERNDMKELKPSPVGAVLHSLLSEIDAAIDAAEQEPPKEQP